MSGFQVGVVNKTQFTSRHLARDITLSIYLPEDYLETELANILFCFDGRDFLRFGQIHRVYERLRKQNEVSRAIFVGFHYENVNKRRIEFHPQGEKAAATVQAVIHEILPWIEETFSTYKAPEGRYLFGDSLAGSIALLCAFSYPRIVNQVGVLSPHSEDVVEQLFQRCQFKEYLNIWHVIGKEEIDFQLPTNGKRADFLTPNRALQQVIQAAATQYEYHELDGGHNWKTWRTVLPDMLKYFLSNQ
ncbi:MULTISPECIES: alpha/beta hydrolase-fold protein [unclassified Staphylococcus]|uniref:esterase family protein n=1 Tax=unclassified Staphylococcus TaxID=91994 RepID=UPI0021CDF08C|nr:MULTISPECIES: alpha/beta hydrolase-fold protein [unclassified Staphylococcus]UXR72191.1 alpha/beta hydrolase-fold protein [Staphylococcus sp. IVB6240]UXR76883.1 alpha/beta hydrolase-fold protein [Staphylococcus sp. IVB6233]